MLPHLRANLMLAGATLLLCSVAYPLVLLGVGKALFPAKAEGSLVLNAQKQPVGSELIGQAFGKDEYFWPRPSAAGDNGYDATASAGSNLAASNPKLRGRVAQTLGPLVRYKKDGPWKGAPAGDDVEAWFTEQSKGRDLVKEWADANPSLLEMWGSSSAVVKAYLKERGLSPAEFFERHLKANPGKWPKIVEVEKDGKTVKEVQPVDKGEDIKAYFFDMWLAEKPHKFDPDKKETKTIDPLTDMEQVAADLVMTSGSGLDPHITLRNALSVYQLDRVAKARAGENADAAKVAATREQIKKLVEDRAFAPLGGLAGEPLVNVLEVNRELDARLPK